MTGQGDADSDGGKAQRLVAAAYSIRDLFSGSEMEMAAWARGLRSTQSGDQLVPQHLAGTTASLLTGHLRDAGVVGDDGRVDEYSLNDFKQVIALLPFFRAEEARRLPRPAPKVVFTVPPAVKLGDEALHLARGLGGRVFDALVSARTRTLLASPYWSDAGADELWAPLQNSVQRGAPITLAGAKQEKDSDHLPAMVRLRDRLHAEGGTVRALQFHPPTAHAIFHAKLVCGEHGYLGSANLTAAGLNWHVEAGLPLDGDDVEQVWWLMGVIEDAGLLRECP